MDTETLLHAYSHGFFPMCEAGQLTWHNPDPRAIIPLDAVHIPRRLAKTVRQAPFRLTLNTAFEAVMRACAQPSVLHHGRDTTWISDDMVATYTELHTAGFAHSIECWQGEQLVGGLYGVAIGRAFMGESMFSTVRDASKVAFVHLVELLNAQQFVLLDVQYSNPHTAQFGVVEIAREEYLQRLEQALG